MATSKAKRSAAAKKAARTRKRNAVAKAKRKKKPTSAKRTSRKKPWELQEEIAEFIKHKLKKSIIEDVKDYKNLNCMSSEGDLRSSVTYHIRNFLDKKKSDLRLHTALYLYPSKIAIRRLAKLSGGKGGNKHEVDVAVSQLSFEQGKAPSRVIGIELKEGVKRADDYVPDDVKKLSILVEDGILKYGFLIYLYKNGPKAADKHETMMKEVTEENRKKVFVIPINATEKIDSIDVDEFNNVYEQTRWLKRALMPELTAKDTMNKRKGNKRKSKKRKSR